MPDAVRSTASGLFIAAAAQTPLAAASELLSASCDLLIARSLFWAAIDLAIEIDEVAGSCPASNKKLRIFRLGVSLELLARFELATRSGETLFCRSLTPSRLK